MATVPAATLAAFGAAEEPVPLGGGSGSTFRAGDLVLKAVDDAAESAWTQDLLARIEPDGFKLPQPVATEAGAMVHDGWIASTFVGGLRPLAPDWSAVVTAGLRFGDAAEGVRDGGEETLDRRTHRWAVADRVAWGEADLSLGDEAQDLRLEILADLGPPAPVRRLVHGDLSGNVFVGPDGVAVILDVSPYLRPHRWAEAIVIMDAVLWHGAGRDLVQAFTHDQAGDLLRRALLFRLAAEAFAPAHRVDIDRYRRVMSTLD
ncbi:MAG: TIGR02569 family protein [Acidimicrobiales bacterium]